jgi:effector-binding domain-containing protein
MLDKIARCGLVLSALVILAGCGARTEKPQASEQFKAELEVLDSMTVATLNRTGPYAGVGAAMQELMAWIEANKIATTGAPFAMFYNAPGEVPPESCSWAVCIPVPENTKPDEKSHIGVSRLPVMDVAFTLHTGSYDKIQATYERLSDWIEDEGLMISGPAIEFYLSPGNVAPESIKVKVGLVVQPLPDSVDEEEQEPATGSS